MSLLDLSARLACVLCIMFSSPPAAQAQSPAQLMGSVLDSTGLPLAGVTITIRGANDRATQTDSKGVFEWQNLPGGQYELTAALQGFAPVRRTLTLAAGQRLTISLTLRVQVLEQTVVTATKAGEAAVQDTPLAVTALTGAELSRMQDRTVEQLAQRVPGMTFSQNTGLAQVTIRGIGTNAVFAGSDPSSAVYLDGVYLARPAMILADFLELERVEVLRGPQGTLYGRNSLGGAVNLITRSPTNEREGSVRLSGGNLDTFRGAARVSGPIVRGRLMGSAAVQKNFQTGMVRDLDHPDDPLGGVDLIAARGQMRAVFNPRAELLFSVDATRNIAPPLYYSKILAVKPGFVVDNPADLHDVRASFPSEGHNYQSGASARFTMDVTPAVRLTSLTAFRQVDFDVLIDGDISELDLTASHVREFQHQLSEEITFAHKGARVTWVTGLFFFSELDHQPTSIVARGLRLENRIDPRVEATASAGFGQATVALASDVAITAGLRYTHERKTIDNRIEFYTIDAPITLLPGAVAFTDAIADDAWSPKFGIEFRARPNLLTYASATRGFKTGGFNATSPEAGRGFAPEWAWSYEAGAKAVFGGGRGKLNVAVFHTDYTDLQVQTPIRPNVFDISNAAAATINGVEVEASLLMGGGVQVGGYLAWLDATYDEYLALGAGNISVDVAGNKLTNAPAWSGHLWIDWTRSLGELGSLSIRAAATGRSTAYFTPFNDTIQRQRPFGLLDLSAEFGPKHRRWFVSAFARNLTNEDYITGSVGTPPPAIGGRPGDRRQLGVQFGIGR
jgi:iron complex outermembrane receptor protein